MSGLYTAIPLILDVQTVFPNWNWQYHALIGFFFFVAFMVWMVWDRQTTISRLLDLMPTILVEPIEENGIYYLKVHNIGAEGILKAQINLSAEDPSVSNLQGYDGYWQKANCNESKILPNQFDCIKIAERISSAPDYNSVHLRIYYYNPKLIESLSSTGGEVYSNTATHWLGAYIEHPDGSTVPLTKHEYKLCVTISSSPKLKEGVYQANYILDVSSLRIDSNSQLTSRNKGSQT